MGYTVGTGVATAQKIVKRPTILQGGYFTGTPQFQYQKENRQAANHSTGFTGTAAMIGWFAVFFLVLKLGGPS